MFKTRVNQIKARVLRRKFRKEHKKSLKGILLYKDYAQLFVKLIDLNQTNIDEIKKVYEFLPNVVQGLIGLVESSNSFLDLFEKSSDHKIFYLRRVFENYFEEKNIKLDEIKKVSSSIEDKLLNDMKNELLVFLNNVQGSLRNVLIVNDLSEMKDYLNALLGSFTLLTDLIKKFRNEVVSKMSFGDMSRRKFLKVLGTSAIYGKELIRIFYESSGLLNSINSLLFVFCKRYKKGKLAILIGDSLGSDKLVGLYDFYVLRVQIMLKMRASIENQRATKKDFYDVLNDPSIDNVVVFCHGSFNSMSFLDGKVTSEDIKRKVKVKKRGFLVKHGCGGDSGGVMFYKGNKEPWGYPVFEKDKIVHWRRIINVVDVILNPWHKRDTWDKFLINYLNENGFKFLEFIKKKI
jgi:hypothetical protein